MSSDSATTRILFVRPAYHTRLSGVVRLVTEPLDLEMLVAVASDEGCPARIHDPMVTRERFTDVLRSFRPAVVAITGYYPARDSMLEHARCAKAMDPTVRVWIGGVHAELNHTDFHRDRVDLVVHSGGAGTFRAALRHLKEGDNPVGLSGTCSRSKTGEWCCAEAATLEVDALPLPDRSHFLDHRDRFAYMDYGPVALVKTAYGCPYGCAFCACRKLNGGRYHPRDLTAVVDEIEHIACDTIWIVDDTFLIDMDRISEFAAMLKRRAVSRRFIIYSRSEFIADHPGVVDLLASMGVIDIIIGLESIHEQRLLDYNKTATEAHNRRAVTLLKAAGIECTGLFIMDLAATHRDFVALDRWIREVGLTRYTLSVFSPFPGTDAYETYRDQLTTTDCRKWDLSHLVMAPTGMSRAGFYLHMAQAVYGPGGAFQLGSFGHLQVHIELPGFGPGHKFTTCLLQHKPATHHQ